MIFPGLFLFAVNSVYDIISDMKIRDTLLLILLIVFLSSVSVITHLSNNTLDNDASGEMVLSHCLFENKSPVCDDWTYGTEFRINNQIVFSLLFFLFNDWITVRIVGTLIIELMLLFSFVFMMHSVRVKTESILFGAILLLLPYCVAYGRIVLYFSFYAPYITFMFIICGCYFKYLDENKKWWVLTFLFTFISCTNGIRQFFTTVAPLLVLHFLLCLKRRDWKYIYKIFPVFFGGISGLLFFYLFILKIVHLEQGAGINIKYKGISELFIVIFSIMRQFGYRSGIPKFTFLWFMSLAGIFVMIYAVYHSITKVLTAKTDSLAIIYGMLPVTLLLNAVTFVLFDLPYNQRYDYARYLTPASVWCIPLFTLISCRIKNKKSSYSFSLIMIIFIGNSIINYCFLHNPNYFSQEYDGLPFRDTSDIGIYRESLNYLRNNKFELGYVFSDANVLTEKLNGVPVIPLEEKNHQIVYLDLLTRKKYREIDTQNVFLFAKYTEAASFLSYPISDFAELVNTEQNEAFIYRITSPEVFREYLSRYYQK